MTGPRNAIPVSRLMDSACPTSAKRLGPAPGDPVELRLEGQRLRLEPPRAELPRQRQRPLGVAPRLRPVRQGVAAEVGGVVGDHLRPEVPDPRRRGDAGERLVERPSRVPDQPSREGHHRPVGDLDAPETVLPAQLDAAAEGVVRADHPAAHVLGVAQAAERRRLVLGRPGLAGQLQAPAVLPQAALDVPAREVQVAAQEVDAGLLGREPEARGGRLGALEVRERPIQVVGDPLDRREPDQRPAPLRVARRRGQRILVGGQGGRHPAEVVQDVGPAGSPGRSGRPGSPASSRPRSARRSASS